MEVRMARRNEMESDDTRMIQGNMGKLLQEYLDVHHVQLVDIRDQAAIKSEQLAHATNDWNHVFDELQQLQVQIDNRKPFRK